MKRPTSRQCRPPSADTINCVESTTVNVIVDETIPEPGPYCPVSVELNNGQRFSHTAKIAKGDPRNPMTEEEVLGKFRSNAMTVITGDAADKLLRRVMQLETLSTVKEIVGLLTPE